MKYIDRLLKNANNELKFKFELNRIKIKINNSKNPYDEAISLVNELNDYCNQRLEQSYKASSYMYVLSSDDFCIFILSRMLNEIKEKLDLSTKAALKVLNMEELTPMLDNVSKGTFVRNVYSVLEVSFENGENYWFDKNEYIETMEIFLTAVLNLNPKILYDLTGVKPIVFCAESGGLEANITMLGIILKKININNFLNKNAVESFDDLYEDLVNQLVETTMVILLNNILSDNDIIKVCNKFNLKVEDFKLELGKQVALMLVNEEATLSNLLKEIYFISKENRLENNKINSYIPDFMDI
ncbi:MAG: hypothetical protein IJ086_13520 [Clostridium sp.]|nr:hypothetical protein [Clostridium sp.]MBQ8999688.1 hypothetical protein [Clostridium sp.]